MAQTLVFIHGWSVTNLNTYGELPLRLRVNGTEVREIFLSRYISFHDEVRMQDVARAFEAAVNEQLLDLITAKKRFACITHSTGGPVAREWWKRFYISKNRLCPMSHLIMLAPANFGSALAKIGKERIGRLKSWFEGTEPGQGILDWLELGSDEAWELNRDWIMSDGSAIGVQGVFPFVIAGEYIDRRFYDNLNSYTGEIGSDGVVRVAGANLEGRYIKLTQPPVANGAASEFVLEADKAAPPTPLRVVAHKSHSGSEMGIMASVRKENSDEQNASTVQAILDCLSVQTPENYKAVYDKFAAETLQVQEQEKIEIVTNTFRFPRYFIHDRFSMVIFRVLDTEGYPVTDYDLILTAGELNSPNHLPEGFFADRQQNGKSPETITYFFNYDIMKGTGEVKDDVGKPPRRAQMDGIDRLGIQIIPRPSTGFVRYAPCQITANAEMFLKAIQPNSTTLIEIRMQRLVDREVFRFEKLVDDVIAFDFRKIQPGANVV